MSDQEVRWPPASALRASKSVAQAPDLGVLGDAMLADQLERRNLDFAPALATDVDHFATAEIVEGWVGQTFSVVNHIL
jgi:hypothetical protein